ncbi:MAG: DNA mismatch repair endonuclease MutL [Legionellales bacterium]|nr:DNA mismatch repair endonuclease MutL [Legionellales bacterium]
MHTRIHLMPSLLANQIAAGEVVERPASVVKELLENCLDAGATQVFIDLERSGIECIRIRDNGAGIVKDDLGLAISRHASSKVLQAADLQAINSLGFRGEALASIAAVAKVNLTSKTQEDEHAWSLKYDPANENMHIEPASHPQGTTVEVSHLFFNVPVRRKFLRSDRTELEHIETVVKQIALSRHDIQIILKHRQSTLLHSRQASTIVQTRQRIGAICGQPFIDHALEINFFDKVMRLTGWLGLAEASRSQSDGQYFYVNGRIVRDKVLNHAVKMAYQDVIPEGRYPCYVLYLELPADTVDVNVHPTKHEVRFYESRQVHDFIVFHLERALHHGVLSESPEKDHEHDLSPSTSQQVINNKTQKIATKPPAKPFSEHFIREPSARYAHETTVEVAQTSSVAKASPLVIKPMDEIKTINFKFLGLVKKAFLLVEIEEGLAIIELEKAFQMSVYELLMAAKPEQPLTGQPLLLPSLLTLAPQQSELLEQKVSFLQRYGILLTRSSQERWLIRELPNILKNSDVSLVLKAFVESKTEASHEQFCLQFAKQITLGDADVAHDSKAQEQLIKTLLSMKDWQNHVLKPGQVIKLLG